MKEKITILITTRNRLDALKISLKKNKHILNKNNVLCSICDDGSEDGTSEYIKEEFPKIELLRNEQTMGYIWSRNMLLNRVKTEFAVSLDDDAHFLSNNPIEHILTHFENNPNCGMIAFRILWGKNINVELDNSEVDYPVKGFVGCGHAWRMNAWYDIPPYPNWFIFYGEEDFASYYLFKTGWTILYSPFIIVQHRVNIAERRKKSDYIFRARNSLSSGWYLYCLFLPWNEIPRKIAYSLWSQFRSKIIKGDFQTVWVLCLAFKDFFSNLPRIIKNRNPLTHAQFREYNGLADSIIFWKPKIKSPQSSNV